jgi:hypothetical protein
LRPGNARRHAFLNRSDFDKEISMTVNRRVYDPVSVGSEDAGTPSAAAATPHPDAELVAETSAVHARAQEVVVAIAAPDGAPQPAGPAVVVQPAAGLGPPPVGGVLWQIVNDLRPSFQGASGALVFASGLGPIGGLAGGVAGVGLGHAMREILRNRAPENREEPWVIGYGKFFLAGAAVSSLISVIPGPAWLAWTGRAALGMEWGTEILTLLHLVWQAAGMEGPPRDVRDDVP